MTIARRTAAPVTPSEVLISLRQEQALANRIISEQETTIRSLQQYEKMMHSFKDTSFGGVAMAQYWCDLMLWEAVLNSNTQLRGIVEIGSWLGGFSRWLHAQAKTRRIGFWTCDAVPPENPPPCFSRVDVWANPEAVADQIALFSPCIVFCDGGNKPRELRTFSPFLDEDSVIAVHDWGTEMLPNAVPAGLEMLYKKQCEEMGSITRFFKVNRATRRQFYDPFIQEGTLPPAEVPVVGVQVEAGVYFHTDQIVSALNQMASVYTGEARNALQDAANYFAGVEPPEEPHDPVARVEIYPDAEGKWYARPVSEDGSILSVTAGSFNRDHVEKEAAEQWPGKGLHELQDAMGDSIWDEQDHPFGFNGRRRPSPRRLWA